jgi:membrane protease YdiL (CAAX protease family)
MGHALRQINKNIKSPIVFTLSAILDGIVGWKCPVCGRINYDSALARCICGYEIDDGSSIGVTEIPTAGHGRISLKSKSLFEVLTAFAIFFSVYVLGGVYLLPVLKRLFPRIPFTTLAAFPASVVAPVVGIVILKWLTDTSPRYRGKNYAHTLSVIAAGIVASWLLTFIEAFLGGTYWPIVRNILDAPSPYYFLNLLFLIICGPLLEETLSRGYFFELLRNHWGEGKALLISSTLFVLPHGMWGHFGPGLLFIFFYSIVFTLTYIEGGLVAAAIVHSFTNFYITYINLP